MQCPPEPPAQQRGLSDNVSAAKSMTSYVPISESMDVKAREGSKKKIEKSFEQTKSSVGLLVTEELDSAIARCRALVESISACCRADNQKFTDEEFDLAGQQEACLWGLDKPKRWEKHYNPADVMRVGEIYEQPMFFVDGAAGNDIKQGKLENCWFLSALAVVATVPGLIEKICVARDELVGVYGFIFFRDGCWVDVIVDDQLFVKFGSYEGIGAGGKAAYPHDQEIYDSLRRRGSEILYYAKSMSSNETWVPLIEKAYAKFYGNYSYLSFGFTMHAMEDLTGGVCRRMKLSDVVDKDRLWHEISRGIDHNTLYGCGSIQSPTHKTIHNLGSQHAYGILRTGEYKGKRFLVIRNPWGNDKEWNGRWSDNAKEWTDEWQPALAILNHSFGADGQFVMEYSDFLREWPMLDITRIFDTSWVSSCIWVHLPGMTEGQVPTWGDVSFTITAAEHTESIIALQEVESRSFKEISGFLKYDLAFVVFKKGSTQEVASSERCLRMIGRSQRVETLLDAGEYVVHVRIRSKRFRKPDYIKEGKKKWDPEIFQKLKARRTEAYSMALNYSHRGSEDLPIALESIAGYDVRELEMNAGRANEKAQSIVTTKELPSGDAETSQSPLIRTEAPFADTNGKTSISGVPADTAASFDEQAISRDEAQSTEASETDEATDTTAATPNQQATETPAPTLVGHKASCNLCNIYPIVGPLFHCINKACPDFDLCQACFDKKVHDQMHEMIVVPTPRQIIHPQKCNTCHASPIVGTLYACTEQGCNSLISCETCFFKGHHPKHLIGMAREVKEEEEERVPEPPAHSGITCNRCGMDPIVGTRYKCTHEQCPAYNLCENCVDKGIHDVMHDASHKMLPLKTREETELLHPGVSDGSPLVLGLRVYTQKSAKVTLRAQLKHGSLMHQSN